MADWQRTHSCGELRDTHIGSTVVLNGWVNTFRSYNDQVFVDLRDRYGVTQVVLEGDTPEIAAIAKEISRECVLSVRGKVSARLTGKENLKLVTGKIEVKAEKVEILNKCRRRHSRSRSSAANWLTRICAFNTAISTSAANRSRAP